MDHQPQVVIDEAMPEEEEGESQEVTQSRKVNKMAFGHQGVEPNFHPASGHGHHQMDNE